MGDVIANSARLRGESARAERYVPEFAIGSEGFAFIRAAVNGSTLCIFRIRLARGPSMRG